MTVTNATILRSCGIRPIADSGSPIQAGKPFLTFVNTPTRLTPINWAAVMITMPIDPAIRAYSIAVAPSSLQQNFLNFCFTVFST